MPGKAMGKTERVPVGIRADELLTLVEAGRRLGLGRKGLLHARAEGLRVARFGRGLFVRGDDLLSFFDMLAERQTGDGVESITEGRGNG